jgi:hypothetical protein
MKKRTEFTKTMKAATKTFLVFLLAVALFPAATLQAAQDQAPARAEKPSQARFRLGAYYEGWTLNDKNLTSFFGHSQRNIGGFEASIHTVFNIDVWVSYRKYSDETRTPVYSNTDKFEMTATSIGLIYRPLVWKILEPFVGAGAEIYSYSETILGETELRPTTGSASGIHAQAGVYINATRFLSGKLFVRLNRVKDALGQPLPDGPSEFDLGGKEFGLGLIFRF